MVSHFTFLQAYPFALRARSRTKWICPAAVFSLFILFTGPLAAQDMRGMQNELNRLRQDVADLQRQQSARGTNVSGKTAISGVTPVGNETAAAQVKVQVDQMDRELRGMVGQIEQLTFRVNQVATQVEKLTADIDFRLTALERGNSGAAPLGAAPPLTMPQGTGRSGISSGRSTSDIDAGVSELPPSSALNSTLQNSRTPPPPPGLAAASPQGSPEEQYAAAFGLLRSGDYAAAADGMELFIKNHPDHELAGNAIYWLGETYYVRKDYARAATYFLDGFQRYPQSRKGPDNLLKLGMTLAALEHKAEACQALMQVTKKYPKAPEKITQRAGSEIKRLSCS